MSYVIQDRTTSEYITNGYSADAKNLSDARLFTKVGHAHACRDFRAARHHVLEVEVVRTVKQEPILQGKWLTLDEYVTKYGTDFYQDGEVFSHPHVSWQYFARLEPLFYTEPVFQVIKNTVYQRVRYDCVMKNAPASHYGNSQDSGPTMVQVHPTKETISHIY